LEYLSHFCQLVCPDHQCWGKKALIFIMEAVVIIQAQVGVLD
jgi:hypothetical protein